ncbi:MAG TPA: hypothetical protein PKX63_03255 [Niabella sp.]|nr:hypothetical protein [Niabella sp.]HRB61566.1 hypothetical protein [Niabella sp.]HRC09366.1 hypothetical protein [Niabella sp.]
MKGINYLAGLGTIFIFLGIFCFRAIVMKNKSMHQANTTISPVAKVLLALSGLLALGVGAFLILSSIKKIS